MPNFTKNFVSPSMIKKINRMKNPVYGTNMNKKSNATSVLFGATFGGNVNQSVYVDIGADFNLMDERPL